MEEEEVVKEKVEENEEEEEVEEEKEEEEEEEEEERRQSTVYESMEAEKGKLRKGSREREANKLTAGFWVMGGVGSKQVSSSFFSSFRNRLVGL